jgi:hypothetical protein
VSVGRVALPLVSDFIKHHHLRDECVYVSSMRKTANSRHRAKVLVHVAGKIRLVKVLREQLEEPFIIT